MDNKLEKNQCGPASCQVVSVMFVAVNTNGIVTGTVQQEKMRQ